MGGAAGHMAHPFDLPEVNTGADLLNFFNEAVRHLKEAPGSIKWDGTNISFKLITDESGQKEFRADRGSSKPSSVIGLSGPAAYKTWEPGHGMPPAIEALLKIFNTALPTIEPELKALGMWDDPTKYFNTEYMKKGITNVIEYDRNILAIHGINQFYEKKAQPWRIEQGIGMDRPGLERPIDPSTGKLTTAGGIEIKYNKDTLNSLIEKVQPIAIKQEFGNYHLVGDQPVELIKDVNFSSTLSSPLVVNYGYDEEGKLFSDTKSLGDWLNEVNNPRDAMVSLANGKKVGALSKLIYLEIWKNGTLIVDLLVDGEEFWEGMKQGNPMEGTDVQKAIDGAVFYHATRMLGNDVLNAATNEAFGDMASHEGIILRGMAEKPVKITGDFILKSLEGRIGKLLEGTLNEMELELPLGRTSVKKRFIPTPKKVYPTEWNVVARKKEREQWVDRFREQFQKEREKAFHEDPLYDWYSESFHDWFKKKKWLATWPSIKLKRSPWGPDDPINWEFHWAPGLEHMPPCDPTIQSCPPVERRPAEEEEIRRDPYYRGFRGHYPLDFSVDPIPLKEQVEQQNDIIVQLEEKRHLALIPGGFKPPHKGHLEMVKFYYKNVGPGGKVIVLMGSGGKQPRTINGRPITLQDSMDIWETYLRNDPEIDWPSDRIEFQNVEGAGPIAPIIDYVREQADPETEVIHLGAGEKDAGRWKMMMDSPKNNPRGVEIRIAPAPNLFDAQGNPLSASAMRQAVEEKDLETFKNYIPDTSLHMAEDMYVKLSGAMLMERKEDSPLPLGIFLGLIEEEAQKLLQEDWRDIHTPSKSETLPWTTALGRLVNKYANLFPETTGQTGAYKTVMEPRGKEYLGAEEVPDERTWYQTLGWNPETGGEILPQQTQITSTDQMNRMSRQPTWDVMRPSSDIPNPAAQRFMKPQPSAGEEAAMTAAELATMLLPVKAPFRGGPWLKGAKNTAMAAAKIAKPRTIAVVPGAYKPPHRGHMDMIKHYADKADEVVILVSPNPRGGVTAQQSAKIWQRYIDSSGIPNVKIEVSQGSPVKSAIEFGNRPEVAGSDIILGASTKPNAKGMADIIRFNRDMQQYSPNVNILDPMEHAYTPRNMGISASDFRQAVQSGQPIQRFVPELGADVSDIEDILWFGKSLNESRPPDQGLWPVPPGEHDPELFTPPAVRKAVPKPIDPLRLETLQSYIDGPNRDAWIWEKGFIWRKMIPNDPCYPNCTQKDVERIYEDKIFPDIEEAILETDITYGYGLDPRYPHRGPYGYFTPNNPRDPYSPKTGAIRIASDLDRKLIPWFSKILTPYEKQEIERHELGGHAIDYSATKRDGGCLRGEPIDQCVKRLAQSGRDFEKMKEAFPWLSRKGGKEEFAKPQELYAGIIIARPNLPRYHEIKGTGTDWKFTAKDIADVRSGNFTWPAIEKEFSPGPISFRDRQKLQKALLHNKKLGTGPNDEEMADIWNQLSMADPIQNPFQEPFQDPFQEPTMVAENTFSSDKLLRLIEEAVNGYVPSAHVSQGNYTSKIWNPAALEAANKNEELEEASSVAGGNVGGYSSPGRRNDSLIREEEEDPPAEPEPITRREPEPVEPKPITKPITRRDPEPEGAYKDPYDDSWITKEFRRPLEDVFKYPAPPKPSKDLIRRYNEDWHSMPEAERNITGEEIEQVLAYDWYRNALKRAIDPLSPMRAGRKRGIETIRGMPGYEHYLKLYGDMKMPEADIKKTVSQQREDMVKNWTDGEDKKRMINFIKKKFMIGRPEPLAPELSITKRTGRAFVKSQLEKALEGQRAERIYRKEYLPFILNTIRNVPIDIISGYSQYKATPRRQYGQEHGSHTHRIGGGKESQHIKIYAREVNKRSKETERSFEDQLKNTINHEIEHAIDKRYQLEKRPQAVERESRMPGTAVDKWGWLSSEQVQLINTVISPGLAFTEIPQEKGGGWLHNEWITYAQNPTEFRSFVKTDLQKDIPWTPAEVQKAWEKGKSSKGNNIWKAMDCSDPAKCAHVINTLAKAEPAPAQKPTTRFVEQKEDPPIEPEPITRRELESERPHGFGRRRIERERGLSYEERVEKITDQTKNDIIKSYTDEKGAHRLAWLRHMDLETYNTKVLPIITKGTRNIPTGFTRPTKLGKTHGHWTPGTTGLYTPEQKMVAPAGKGALVLPAHIQIHHEVPDVNLEYVSGHEHEHHISAHEDLVKLLKQHSRILKKGKSGDKNLADLQAIAISQIVDIDEGGAFAKLTGKTWRSGQKGEWLEWRLKPGEVRADAMDLRKTFYKELGRDITKTDLSNLCIGGIDLAGMSKEEEEDQSKAFGLLLKHRLGEIFSCKDVDNTYNNYKTIVKTAPAQKPTTRFVEQKNDELVEEVMNYLLHKNGAK